jgi:hypothetical protein
MNYLSIRIATTYVRQTGDLQPPFLPDRFSVGGKYWVTDLGFVYRIPGRRGELTFGVSNLFDNRLVGYQDSDATVPLFTRGQFVFGKVTFQFY